MIYAVTIRSARSRTTIWKCFTFQVQIHLAGAGQKQGVALAEE
jgi:hypothetical protein